MERVRGNGVDSFKQQELQAWQPVLTPVAVIAVLLGVALVFMPIGIVLRDASEDVVSYKKRYDNIEECKVTDDMTAADLPLNCTVSITIEEDMDAPVYFYYELENFYQNNRRYLQSKNDDQLMGEGNSEVTDCEPLKSYTRTNNNSNSASKKLVACGLVASSFFLDRYNMHINGENLCGSNCTNYGKNNEADWGEYWQDWYSEPNWAKDGIAWTSDVDDKFGYNEIDNTSQTQYGQRQIQTGVRLPDTDDEDFIVWMRVAALPNFRKLHRIIRDKDIKKGDNVTIEILSWFEVSSFSGSKYVVISTTEWCGGENYGLAWTFIIVSTIAIFLAVLFAVLLLFGSRKMGDVDMFEWSNRPKKASSLVHLS